MKYSVRG